MTSAAVEKELMDLEKEYWQAIRNRDAKTAARLTDDHCVVVGAQGIGEIDKRSIGEMVEAAPYDIEQFSMDGKDVHIRTLGNDVAIVAYKVNERMTIDGKPTSLEAYDSSVWHRRNGKWVCTLHTESLAGDPFGRS